MPNIHNKSSRNVGAKIHLDHYLHLESIHNCNFLRLCSLEWLQRRKFVLFTLWFMWLFPYLFNAVILCGPQQSGNDVHRPPDLTPEWPAARPPLPQAAPAEAPQLQRRGGRNTPAHAPHCSAYSGPHMQATIYSRLVREKHNKINKMVITIQLQLVVTTTTHCLLYIWMGCHVRIEDYRSPAETRIRFPVLTHLHKLSLQRVGCLLFR